MGVFISIWLYLSCAGDSGRGLLLSMGGDAWVALDR